MKKNEIKQTESVVLATAQDIARIYMMHNLLENEGIKSFVQHENANSAIGGLLREVNPALCVERKDMEDARAILIKNGYTSNIIYEKPRSKRRLKKSMIYAAIILLSAILVLVIWNLLLNLH